MKIYEYNLNGVVRGRAEARNKRAVKKLCKRLAQIYFPLRGVETLKIKKVKGAEASIRVI